MRALKLLAPGLLELHNVPTLGAVKDSTVRVHVSACGICGSDLALYNGVRDLSNEHYFGHEFSGIITETGSTANKLKVGMRVASELVRGCGRCWYCRNDLQNYCRSMNEALLPGGFSEITDVLNIDDYCFLSPIPDELDDITAAVLEPANCAYRVALQANINPGDTVLVIGLGAIGIISGLILQTLGAGKIIGAECSKPRLKQVRNTGLLDVIDTADPNWMDQIREIISKVGVDVVIEATGVPIVLKDAMMIVRTGGTIVVPSVYHGSIKNFDPLPIMRKELTIIGAKGPAPFLKTDGTSAVVDKVIQIKDELRKIITIYDYKDSLQAFTA